MDQKCRVCCADGSLLTKTFGSGIAYPTRTNDGMSCSDHGKPDPRADSFSLYCNWVGNRVLLNVLPKTQLGNKLHRTMRNNRKKAIENNPANNNNANQSPKKGSPKKIAKMDSSPKKPMTPAKQASDVKSPIKPSTPMKHARTMTPVKRVTSSKPQVKKADSVPVGNG